MQFPLYWIVSARLKHTEILVRNSCLKCVSRGNRIKIKGHNWMHSTISYIKRIFAFQRGLQIQLHNESLWKWQQLHMPQNMNLSVFLNEPVPLPTARESKYSQITTVIHINAQFSLNLCFWKIWWRLLDHLFLIFHAEWWWNFLFSYYSLLRFVDIWGTKHMIFLLQELKHLNIWQNKHVEIDLKLWLSSPL